MESLRRIFRRFRNPVDTETINPDGVVYNILSYIYINTVSYVHKVLGNA